MIYLVVIAATFGVMFLLDKGLTKLFRSRDQHRSGTAVRLKKHFGILSLALMALGVLGIYYLTHGIFYDDDSFLYVRFGNNGREYRYADIVGQKLYEIQGGTLLVELHMTDGTTVAVQGNMDGAPGFLDKAAHARMRQLGLNSHECPWFDETEGRWFPPVEE